MIYILLCILFSLFAYGCYVEIQNSIKRNEILELARQEKEINLHRIKERQKYVNVILDFEKEEESK